MDGIHKLATLAFEAAETVAIAGGVLTVTQGYTSIDAETGSSDTLDTITLTSAPSGYGVWLVLKAATGDTITISHNSGNIKTASGNNITLSGDKHLYALHNGTNVFVADAGGTGAPTDATYLVQTASSGLSAEQAMGALATGIVKNTTSTGVQSIAVAGTDYTSPTGTENLSNKTITASSLIATALSLLIGGFRAIFTHAFSADRTVTLPGDADVTLVGVDTVQTLGGKTLTAPRINQINDTNGNEEIIFTTTASAVNELTVANAATGNNPSIAATGGDADVGITLSPKGTGAVAVAGKQTITGNADAVQLTVTANATQSNAIALFRDSGGNTQVSIAPLGGMTINEEGNDSDTRIESADNANAFVVNAGTNNVGIGTDTPDTDVILDVVSTEKASRPFPSMSEAQRDAIATPATAGVIWNTDSEQFEYWDGADWVALSGGGGGATPTGLKTGLTLTKEAAGIINVGVGSIEVDGTVVVNTAVKRLTVSTNGDWIGGTQLEAASTYVCQYVNAAGDFKLHNALPNYPCADLASRITTSQVNQSGWNGTGGSGLNATSVIYDNDSGGEASITAGMYVLIYDDSAFTEGRGRGSGATDSVNNASLAKITAVNTGTNTLTLEAGHQIAINDDDYLVVIQPGALEYIDVSGTWWRFNGRIFNDSSQDLDDTQLAYRAESRITGTNYSTSSTSFVDISATVFSRQILTSGKDIRMSFEALIAVGAAMNGYLDFALDGVRVGGTDGSGFVGTNVAVQATMSWLAAVLPGTHTVTMQWKVDASTVNLYTSTVASRAQFAIWEGSQ